MIIKLYTTKSENNRLKKVLENEVELTGVLKNSSEVITPIIQIGVVDATVYNYVYIPSFSRYYYITEIKSDAMGLWTLSLKCDVLMTYKDEILSLDVIIGRNEKKMNTYLHDTEQKSFAYRYFKTKLFSKSLSDNTYYLTVLNGGSI